MFVMDGVAAVVSVLAHEGDAYKKGCWRSRGITR